MSIAFLIATVAILFAMWSHSKLMDLKDEVTRLRRDLNALGLDVDLDISGLKNPDIRQSSVAVEVKARTSKSKSTAASYGAPSQLQKKLNTAKSSSQTSSEKKPRKSFEEMLGAQWSVWVGGLALFLGAIFLLRYSIEAGVFSPAMRVVMAGVLGIIFLMVSEGLHRRDKAPDTSVSWANKFGLKLGNKTTEPSTGQDYTQKAHIPGILAAVGIFSLLGAVYASYALYSFITPTPAFILLGALSICAMELSLRHGPILATLGLVASFATPLLVETETSNIYQLYGYLIIIAAAAIVVARIRNWEWLTSLTLYSLLGGQ